MYVSTTISKIITTIVVDDGLAVCQDYSYLLDMVNYLKQHFEVTSGFATIYVNIKITHKRATHQLWINQS